MLAGQTALWPASHERWTGGATYDVSVRDYVLREQQVLAHIASMGLDLVC